MKKFLIKLLKVSSFGIILFIMLIATYIIYDPFKVLKDYPNYTKLDIIPNRDYISTVMFDKNRKKYNYNSFIFGSSRTLAYRPEEWQKYLPKNSSPYSFDSTAELLYGIYTKMKYIDSLDVNIDNSLIILCRDYTFSELTDYSSHLKIHHYKTVRVNKIKYHLTFLKAYASVKFLSNFYLYKISGKSYQWLDGPGVIAGKGLSYHPIHNSVILTEVEDRIKKDRDEFYEIQKDQFYERSENEKTDEIQRIKKHHKILLEKIKKIFDKHKTNYKVIVGPLYDEIKLHKKDKEILTTIFGNNLYDFSGKSEFTKTKYNYFESSHYRPKVGAEILKMIYKDSLN